MNRICLGQSICILSFIAIFAQENFKPQDKENSKSIEQNNQTSLVKLGWNLMKLAKYN